MKLYTLYAPPNHRDGVVHHTRAEADKDKEHFDSKLTKMAAGPSQGMGHPAQLYSLSQRMACQMTG